MNHVFIDVINECGTYLVGAFAVVGMEGGVDDGGVTEINNFKACALKY